MSVPAGAATAADVRGKWANTDQCPSGCAFTSYDATFNITSEDFSTGAFSGTETDARDGAVLTLVGIVTGTAINITVSRAGYSEQRTGNFGPNGRAFTGSWTDSEGHHGSFATKRPK